MAFTLSPEEEKYAKSLKDLGIPSNQIAERVLGKRESAKQPPPPPEKKEEFGIKEATEVNSGFLASKTDLISPNQFIKHELGKGIAKSAIGTAVGGAELIGQGMSWGMSKLPYIGDKAPDMSPEQRPEVLKKLTTPVGAYQKVGKVGGDIGQFFIPFGGAARGAAKAPKALKTGGKILKTLKGSGIEMAKTAPIMAAQEGEINKEVAEGTGIAGAFPVVGAGLKTGLKAFRAVKAAKAAKNIDDIVGKIIQGEAKDIPLAKKALSEVDTTGVKTYDDLADIFNTHKKVLVNKQDKLLTKEGGLFKTKDLVKTTQVGDEVVSQNFVRKALDDLAEMYGKIGAMPKKAGVANTIKKFNSSGLTKKELNDVARTYGSEFKRKAFSKAGDPLTSVNAQMFENTRKGVKETVRSGSNPAIQAIDESLSSIYSTEDLIGKMQKNVNKITQTIEKRGIMEKIGRAFGMPVGFIAEKAGIKSFVIKALLPSNVGVKRMNSLGIQSVLKKNLDDVNSALNQGDDALKDYFIKLWERQNSAIRSGEIRGAAKVLTPEDDQ